MPSADAESPRALDRRILSLALPALGALVAEPLFLLTDTAMVGHLGPEALAGLAIASTVLQAVLGLMIFLAYATTPRVARLLGAGDTRGAVSAGFDGMWLALGVGLVLFAGGLFAAEPVVRAFGPEEAVADAAVTYLSVSLWGLPAMLVVIAATGLLRGLQDTRTPLLVAGLGFAANIPLNALFIYGLDGGIGGSALGTVIAQWAMMAIYLVIAARAAARHGARLWPDFSGVWSAARTSGWLLVRNATLRVAMLATVFAGTSAGVADLAALQVALTIFSTLAFALDSLAIAGQAMIGLDLGAARTGRVRRVTRRLLGWGVGFGLVIGALLAVLAPFLGPLFSPSEDVRTILTFTIWVMAAGVPLAGYVFVLDGVLMGAGDARYLAVAGVISLLVYLPALWLAASAGAGGDFSVAAIWVAFGGAFMGARALTLGLRARSNAWMVVGR